jgi:hypothetical protein
MRAELQEALSVLQSAMLSRMGGNVQFDLQDGESAVLRKCETKMPRASSKEKNHAQYSNGK